MKIKMRPLFVLVGLCTGLLFLNASGSGGCGASGGGAGDVPGSGGGAGEASVASLSTVPTLDLSTLDSSASSSAALSALSARLSKSAIVRRGKKFGEGMRDEGNSSRAGCEANAHKDEIFRMSQMAQLDRCYTEAMEAAGLIAIGEGFTHYSLTPPEMGGDEMGGMCDGIPEDRGDEKARCEAETSGGPKAIKIRLGLISGVLQIDMCESDVLQNEADYAASGAVYSASVTRIGAHLGETDSSKFAMTVDLGTTGVVTDGLVTIGDGSAVASAQMNSRFGDGLISFDATSSTNAISGAFAGAFTDPFTDVATTFTGKVHSEFGPTNGCAKFSFTGSPPPMRVQNMIPFDIAADQLSGFLQTLGLELGITLTVDNYLTVNLCPNPAFDPEAFDASVKPMVAVSGDGTCATVTHTGIECFSIATGATTTDFGSTEFSQAFTVIATADSAFYAAVNAFDLSDLDPTVDTVAFVRDWDCAPPAGGAFTAIAFESMTAAQMALLEPAMEKCFAIEEKAFNREGMGGYNCHEQENMNGINDMAQSPPDFGPYGGEYVLDPLIGNCPADTVPEYLFADALDVDGGEYCFPMDGNCLPFTVVAGSPPAAAPDPALALPFGGLSITAMAYMQLDPLLPAASVMVTFSDPDIGPCNQQYDIHQPTFDAPPEFGGGGEMGPPQACIDLFGDDVTEAECRGFCSSPDGHDACGPPPT